MGEMSTDVGQRRCTTLNYAATVSGVTTTNTPASPPQLGFIQRLLAERTSQAPEGIDAFMAVLQTKRITKTGASSLINHLLSIPADVVEAPAATDAPARDLSRRSNAYPGKCIKCGQGVAAREGYLTGSRGNWGCEHLEGACPAAAEATTPGVHALTEIVGDLEDGNYAIPATSGETDVWYFTIKTNKGFYNPEKKGQRIVRMVAGGGNEFPITNEWVRKAVTSVRAMGTTESMQMFAREMHICGRCGEDLTQVTSKVTGFGPVCRRKIGYEVSPVEKAEIARLIAEAQARGEELAV